MGYWAVNIVTGVPKAIPLKGSPLVELLRGSASVGQSLFFYSLQYFCIASS
jgi:cytochrome b6